MNNKRIRAENERISHRLDVVRMMPSIYAKKKKKKKNSNEILLRKKRKMREENKRGEIFRKRLDIVKPTINVREKLKKKKRLAKVFKGLSPLRAAEKGSSNWIEWLSKAKERLLSKPASPETTSVTTEKKTIIPVVNVKKKQSVENLTMSLYSPTSGDARGISVENYLTMFRPSIFSSSPPRSPTTKRRKQPQDFVNDENMVELMVPQTCHVPILSATDGSRVTMLVTLHDNSENKVYTSSISVVAKKTPNQDARWRRELRGKKTENNKEIYQFKIPTENLAHIVRQYAEERGVLRQVVDMILRKRKGRVHKHYTSPRLQSTLLRRLLRFVTSRLVIEKGKLTLLFEAGCTLETMIKRLNAARTIQCLMRRRDASKTLYKLQLEYAEARRTGATRIQCYIRTRFAKKEFQRRVMKYEAARTLQSLYRMRSKVNQMNQKRNAAKCIQRFVRGFQRYRTYMARLKALQLIQRVARYWEMRARIRTCLDSSLRIQKWLRMTRAQMKYQIVLKSLRTFQLLASTKYARNEFETMRRRVIIVQRVVRGRIARQRFQIIQNGVRILQKIFRVRKYRQRTSNLTRMLKVYAAVLKLKQRQIQAHRNSEQNRYECAVKIQSVVRSFASRKQFSRMMCEVCVLNTFARRFVFLETCKSTSTIQRVCRGYLTRLSLTKRKEAATRIQLKFRFYRDQQMKRTAHKHANNCAIKLQTFWRRVHSLKFYRESIDRIEQVQALMCGEVQSQEHVVRVHASRVLQDTYRDWKQEIRLQSIIKIQTKWRQVCQTRIYQSVIRNLKTLQLVARTKSRVSSFSIKCSSARIIQIWIRCKLKLIREAALERRKRNFEKSRLERNKRLKLLRKRRKMKKRVEKKKRKIWNLQVSRTRKAYGSLLRSPSNKSKNKDKKKKKKQDLILMYESDCTPTQWRTWLFQNTD